MGVKIGVQFEGEIYAEGVREYNGKDSDFGWAIKISNMCIEIS